VVKTRTTSQHSTPGKMSVVGLQVSLATHRWITVSSLSGFWRREDKLKDLAKRSVQYCVATNALPVLD